MEWITVKMPEEKYKSYTSSMRNDWIVIERWVETEQIKKAEVELFTMKEGIKRLGKELFELKHPKK